MRNDPESQAIPLGAARLAFAGAAAFVALLTSLHLLKPELDPSWRFISEYAIGDFGWVMVLAFLSLALGYAALFLALRSQIRSLDGRIGLALLLISALSLTMGGVFTSDPITTSREAMTASGRLHSLAGTLGIVMPFAAAMVSWSLARNRAWLSQRRPLLWAAGLAVLGFLTSLVSLGVMLSRSGGTFGPDVPVGWPNRIEIMSYSIWLMVVAWCAAKLRR